MPQLAPTPTRSIRIRVGGVYIHNQQLLLVRHAKAGRTYWLLPGGGVEPGEALARALERETVEECGLVTRTEQLLFVSDAISPIGDRHFLNLTFRGAILDGTAKLTEVGGRVVEVAWMPRDRLATIELLPDFAPSLIRAWDEGFVAPPAYLGNLWRE